METLYTSIFERNKIEKMINSTKSIPMKSINILVYILFLTFTNNLFAQKKGTQSKIIQKKLDRTKLPEAAPAPIIKIGKAENFTLANGLKIYLVKNTKLPRIAFNLVLDRDPLVEGELAGLTSAVGDLLSTGTKSRSKDQFDEETDFIGATINTSSTGIYAASLKKHTEKLLDLMSDVVLNPNFTQIELDKIKKQLKSNLASNKDNPNSIAGRISQVVLFGKDHPYGEQMTNKTLDNISIDACNNYYNSYFKPNIGYLAVVGDISLEEAKPMIEKQFGNWQRAEVPRKMYASANRIEKTKVILVDRPSSVQSVINIVNTADLKLNSPDLIKAKLTNDILGGGEARLFNNLREKRGFTYGAYSNLAPDRLVGKFTANASVRNAVTDSSITEFFNELNKIRNTTPSPEELDRTKNDISGKFIFSLENPQTVANFAINTARYNLPGDYYTNYLKNVEATSVIDVQNMALKYIQPNNCYIVVVGKAYEIAEKLKKYGEIEYYDVDGNKVEAPKPPKPIEKNITAENILDKYLTAIGGKEKLASVKDLAISMTGNIPNGPAISTFLAKKAPNKSLQEVKAMGNTVQKLVVSGIAASMNARGQESQLKGNELAQAISKSSLFYELNPQKVGINTKLDGTEKVDGKDCTKIIYSIGEAKWTEYFENTTGLKMRSVENRKSPTGDIQVIIDYADYKEFDGIKLPTTVKQNMGQNIVELKLESVKINKGIDDKIFNIK